VRLELHPEARAELRRAALWYDEQRPGLGDEFIADVSATLDRIGGTPESYPVWPRAAQVDPMKTLQQEWLFHPSRSLNAELTKPAANRTISSAG
jgi:hypothetical protein